LDSVEVRQKGSTWKTFTPKGRFLLCRPSGAGSRNCAMTLEEGVPSGGSNTPTASPVCSPPGKIPKVLTSDFRPPSADSQEGMVAAQVSYSGFEVWLDCARNAAYRFEYMAYNDCGSLPRHAGFKRDPNFSKSCQQKNGKAYKATEGVAFDRGHLVPANHLDGDATAIMQSNYMTNILPQAALMNRGAWLQTEEIIECWRVKEPLHVVGGAIFDDSSPRHAWFKESHNVDNPTYFWKVVTASTLFPEDNNRIAWLLPNLETAKRDQLDKYLVSISELEAALTEAGQSQKFALSDSEKKSKPSKSWALPAGCDKSL